MSKSNVIQVQFGSKKPRVGIAGAKQIDSGLFWFYAARWIDLRRIESPRSSKGTLQEMVIEKCQKRVKKKSVLDFSASDFEQLEHYLSGQITLIIKRDFRVASYVNEENRLKSLIHQRCAEIGVSESERRNYQLLNYGVDSLKFFNIVQLREMYEFLLKCRRGVAL